MTVTNTGTMTKTHKKNVIPACPPRPWRRSFGVVDVAVVVVGCGDVDVVDADACPSSWSEADVLLSTTTTTASDSIWSTNSLEGPASLTTAPNPPGAPPST